MTPTGLRDYFDVQLLFAERMSERLSISLSAACLTYTNLHRRFGLGTARTAGPAAGWAAFAERLDACASPDERLEWTLAFHRQATPEPSAGPVFGCFKYDPPDTAGVVRIHFSNRDGDDRAGPLAAANRERRMGDLRAMFGHVWRNHPEARQVRGASWLYNLEAYRRLFPPAYTLMRREPERVWLDGTSSWGQLLNFTGAVKPDVRAALIGNLGDLDPQAPWRVFPLRALSVTADIERFYDHYGC